MDVFVKDDIAGGVTIGNRVVVSGTVYFNQGTSGNKKKAKFDPYLGGDNSTRSAGRSCSGDGTANVTAPTEPD